MPLPPQIAIPRAAAIAASRSRSEGPSGPPGRSSGASYRDEKVTALAAPAAAASVSVRSSCAFATPRIARSTASGTSAIEG